MAVFRKAIVKMWDEIELEVWGLSQIRSVWGLGKAIVVE